VLWLCLFFPNLPVDVLGLRPDRPVAVVDRHRGRRRVVACNQIARVHGVAVSLDAVAASARVPELQLLNRNLASERRGLEALGAWAIQYSADICIDTARWLVWIEIGASLAYFQGWEALRAQVLDDLAELGHFVHLGVAPTLEAAALLAKDRASPSVLTLEELPHAIGSLPLTRLAVAREVKEQLNASGLSLIQEVIALSRADLARRFGPDVPDYLQQLYGTLADPRVRYRAPEHYRRQFECGYPIETVEGLLFPLKRLLQELQGFLRGRDCAIQTLTITLRHRDAADTVLQLRSTTTEREASRWFVLLRERLERTHLLAPVTHVRFHADQLLPPSIVQTDLLDDDARRQSGWVQLLDKLRARLGTSAVKQLGLSDDHRPERAWVLDGGAHSEAAVSDYPHRPLWLLHRPVAIRQLPRLCGKPERIEAGWASGEDSQRDYYLALSEDGARLWLFKDAQTKEWYVHGIWG
jgi:protein ImuB